jgi:hypothetical protein
MAAPVGFDIFDALAAVEVIRPQVEVCVFEMSERDWRQMVAAE